MAAMTNVALAFKKAEDDGGDICCWFRE